MNLAYNLYNEQSTNSNLRTTASGTKIYALKPRTNNPKPNQPKYTNQIKRTAVQPLVGADIQRAKDYLLARPERYANCAINLRDYTLFCFNINIGLRCGDLLHLKIGDIVKDGKIVDSIRFQEQKSKKTRDLFFNEQLKEILLRYINSMPDQQSDWFLFHALWPHKKPYKPMTIRNLNYVMKDIEKGLNLDIPLGTHSLRKTFARAIFDRESAKGNMMAIEVLKDLLGHSSTAITRHYIGLNREMVRDIFTDGDMI